MRLEDHIVITGSAGFIGSYLCGYLNRAGYYDITLVDDFSPVAKMPNLEGKKYARLVDRSVFSSWMDKHGSSVNFIFHLGARTDTTEMNYEVHRQWNLEYSKMVWQHSVRLGIPLVYASSAATYGNGELGYKDDHNIIHNLHPLNPYGQSKNDFDIWALDQAQTPPFWTGLKFFNVFGPNEYHKGRMASVIFHAYNQIKASGSVKLFRSHNPRYSDGGQMRDFIYVKDVAGICKWLMDNRPASGLYNTGTGKARTFRDLVEAIFNTLGLPANIEFIDTPLDIRDKYQYFTEADMHKLKAAGYDIPFYSLEEGVKEYVSEFLLPGKYY
jgi:ADP-L-glycero-D-manno-heptose 6-epimerase